MMKSRRAFLSATLGAAAIAATGCAPKPSEPLQPTAGQEKAVLVAEGMH